MVLSILIPTIQERQEIFSGLLETLHKQAGGKSVQVLWLGDNFSMTTGGKRNKLMDIADGDYLCFVDDDDEITGDYVQTILSNIRNIDCYGIGGWHTVDGKHKAVYDFDPKHGKNHHERINGEKYMRYLPNHLCVWRSDIARRVRFPEKSLAEDHEWAQLQALKGYTFMKINKLIYHYDLNKSISMRYK